ncbi:MAG: UDP-N-acetylglucosamine 2-epimerase, partial [Planctomycetota bacterium]|nr:UDP-N-acetylglucosamine 2-epimerase [Planctomycetota bacterium]
TMWAPLPVDPPAAAGRGVLGWGGAGGGVPGGGGGSLAHFRVGPIPDRSELEAGLGHGLGDRLVLAAVHPVTLARDPVQDAHALLDALERRARPGEVVVFAFPNADEGSRRVREAVRSFVEAREGAALHTNLEARAWIGLLHQASVVVGNSSSILMETPSVPVPAVCVGTRQAGRERAANVLDADAEPGAILAALEEAETLSMEGVINPYGDGNASARIRRVLEEAPDRERLLSKTTTLS